MTGERLFLDTAYVIALLNPRDSYHNKAKSLLNRFKNAREILTTEAVLTEIGNSFASSNRSAAVSFIMSCYATLNINVITVDSSLFHKALDFYSSRHDKSWGLTDCISFVVMQEYHLTEALTNDRHFNQVGFNALLLSL